MTQTVRMQQLLPARVTAALISLGLVVITGCTDDGASTSASSDGSASTTTTSTPTTVIDVEPVLVPTGLDVDQPIALVAAPEGDVLFVAARAGQVLAVEPDGDRLEAAGEPVLDLTELVGSTEGERGLLGLAVAPDGEHLYASYTEASRGDSRVDEFELRADGDSWRADRDSRRTLVEVEQPFSNHNGGHIEFGPDGMLYLGLGDGGAADDPGGRAQDPSDLLGKMVRLDPEADPPIPADNPFVGDDALDARDEIWATGLRNPWRFTFDRETGDLWVADVGQNLFEEINRLRADEGNGKGANFGWDLFEGDQPFEAADPAPGAASEGPFVEPVFTYGRDRGCSVTGGVVYRGSELPDLVGTYLFADLCSAGVRGLVADGDGVAEAEVVDGPDQVVSFGQDRDGEVYVLSITEGISRLRAA